MGVISASILKAAGSEVQEELYKKQPKGMDFGQLVDTSAGALNCKAIYHGPIPPWKGGAGEEVSTCKCAESVSIYHSVNKGQ